MRSFASYSNLVEIGRGGMAKVYRANSPTGHLVALKILSLHLANDRSAVLRFKQESNLGLQHPNIVRVIESDFDDKRGEPYIVMEYVPSESLEQRLTRVKRLAPNDVARIVTDVARALDYAHDKGIVHRDVKPGNILLRTSNDQALLTDFGIAKTQFATAFTATIARVGSVLYMSPEQANGTPSLTRASDIYSLGVTAYYALSGRHPFESSDPIVVARQHIDARPPHVCDQNPSIPRNVGDVVMQALSKQPYQRPPSAGRFARLLTEAVQGKPANDPMTKTTATLRMPPSHTRVTGQAQTAPAAASPSPTASVPVQASRTVPSTIRPITEGPFTSSPPTNPNSSSSSGQPWPWLLGAGVLLAGLAFLVVLFIDTESTPTPSVPTPYAPPTALIAPIQPNTAGTTILVTASPIPSGPNTSQAPTIYPTSTSLSLILPTRPNARPPAPTTPRNPAPTSIPATAFIPEPSSTPITIFTPVVIPTDTPPPIPTDTPIPSPTLAPSDTPSVPDAPTPLPGATDTPIPTNTPEPTATLTT